MGPSEVEEMLLRQPFRPVRLTLASGDQIIVREEDDPFVSGLSLALGGIREGTRIETGARLVSVPNIVLAEWIDPRPSHGRRPR